MFGKITKISGRKLEIELDEDVDMYRVQRLSNGKQPTVELSVQDSRLITSDQRKKIYALINDLCNYTGDLPEYWKIRFKFAVEMIFKVKPFSLSNCSVTV